MATMMYGYHYDRGIRIGYNIHFGNFVLHFVSTKDKNRIMSEIKKSGYKKEEIIIKKINTNQ